MASSEAGKAPARPELLAHKGQLVLIRSMRSEDEEETGGLDLRDRFIVFCQRASLPSHRYLFVLD